jgi:hypothetical protein
MKEFKNHSDDEIKQLIAIECECKNAVGDILEKNNLSLDDMMKIFALMTVENFAIVIAHYNDEKICRYIINEAIRESARYRKILAKVECKAKPSVHDETKMKRTEI